MSTTIVPSLGHAPILTQQGTGATPGYDAIDFRRLANAGLQEGVMEATSYEVTQRGAGANLSVDIAANATPAANGVAAYVQGDAVTGQSLYPVPAHTAVINEAITAAHATLPRVDRVILEMQDQTHDGSGAYAARTRVVTGTATAGATLDNLTGAAAVPSSALLLADVLIAATDTAIGNTEIRDRRKWARGALFAASRTAGNVTSSSATPAAVDSTNLNPRIECSGSPMRVTVTSAVAHSSALGEVYLGVAVDGVVQSATHFTPDTANEFTPISGTWVITPAAGSHKIAPFWAAGIATGTLEANASAPFHFTLMEIVRQNTANNATTSG